MWLPGYDAAGTGDMMYEIWYGANDRGSLLADARLAWLAVPRGYATVSYCQAYCWAMKMRGPNNVAAIYGRPTSDSQYVIGYAKAGSVFISGMRVAEDPPPPTPTPLPTATATNTPLPTPRPRRIRRSRPRPDTPAPTATDTPLPTATGTTGAAAIAPLAMVTLATGDIWYEINFNHRQAWVPASEVLFV